MIPDEVKKKQRALDEKFRQSLDPLRPLKAFDRAIPNRHDQLVGGLECVHHLLSADRHFNARAAGVIQSFIESVLDGTWDGWQ